MIEGQTVTIYFNKEDNYGYSGKLVKMDAIGIMVKIYIESRYKLTLFPWHVIHSVEAYL